MPSRAPRSEDSEFIESLRDGPESPDDPRVLELPHVGIARAPERDGADIGRRARQGFGLLEREPLAVTLMRLARRYAFLRFYERQRYEIGHRHSHLPSNPGPHRIP